MSTSRSEKQGEEASSHGSEAPEAASSTSNASKPKVPPNLGGIGIAGLFQRAVAAQAEKAPTPVLRAGVGIMTCHHCGAPRQGEALVCSFCEEKL